MRKLLKVKRKKRFLIEFVNDFHKVGSIVIAVISAVIIIINVNYSYPPPIEMTYLICIIFMVQHGFHAFMQWKYPVIEREYIITLIHIFFFLIIFFLIENWIDWIKQVAIIIIILN